MKSCSQPTVTVIVPVYKVEDFLPRCVESILCQSYTDLEIILVDDGSPDGCGALCDGYHDRDARVRVIHQKNGGLSAARNAGIRAAAGEYLCFVDSDDYIQRDMIEQLVAAARSCDAPISACGFTSEEKQLESGLSEKLKVFTDAEAIREILKDGEICTSAWAKLYEKGLFDGILFPEGMYYEDYATVYKLFHRAGRVAFADTEKYFYTYNPSGITKSAFSAKHMDYFRVSDELAAFVSVHYPELEKAVLHRATDMAVSLFRKLSATAQPGRFAAEEKELVSRIRRDGIAFLSSRYALPKKLSALAVTLFPGLTHRLFTALYFRP